jgi:hypothetical protein
MSGDGSNDVYRGKAVERCVYFGKGGTHLFHHGDTEDTENSRGRGGFLVIRSTSDASDSDASHFSEGGGSVSHSPAGLHLVPHCLSLLPDPAFLRVLRVSVVNRF